MLTYPKLTSVPVSIPPYTQLAENNENFQNIDTNTNLSEPDYSQLQVTPNINNIQTPIPLETTTPVVDPNLVQE
jgi:hypothetical protein